MKKKVLSMLLSGAMIASLLSGCGASAGTTNETAQDTASAQEGAKEVTGDANEEAVTITILSLKTEDGPQSAFQTMFDNFSAEHENVKFDIQTMSSDDLKATLRSRAASGDMPDIITWMKEVDESLLLDLTVDDYLSNINPETLAGANAIYTDTTYAMPLDNGYIGLYYNKDVLAENNLEVPATYDELISCCQELEAKGITPFGNSLSDLSVPYIALIGLFAENVFYNNPDWSAQRDNNEKSFLEDEQWKLSFDQLKNTVYQYGDPDTAYNLSYDDCAANFANGENAFYFQGSWALSSFREVNKEANIGIMGFPVSNNPEDAVMLCFPDTSLSICKDSKNIEISKEFLAYVASEEAGTIWSTACAASSSVSGVSVDWDPIAADIDSYLSSGKFTALGDRALRSTFTDKLWETFSYYMLDESDWETEASVLDEYWDKARDEAATQ